MHPTRKQLTDRLLLSVHSLPDEKLATVINFIDHLRSASDQQSSEHTAAADVDLFWSSFEAWRDERSIEAMCEDIQSSRVSKSEPPRL